MPEKRRVTSHSLRWCARFEDRGHRWGKARRGGIPAELRRHVVSWVFLACSMVSMGTRAADGPPGAMLSEREITNRVSSLARTFPESVRVRWLGPSIPLLELGSLPAARRSQEPALLVVGGIEPDDQIGVQVVLGSAEALLAAAKTNEASRRTLDSTTVFLLPRLGAGEMPGRETPRRERAVSGQPPVDDDHDGLIDEDGPDDLNGDGSVTRMRVRDPGGEYIEDPAEPRLLMKADPAKGERGAWRWLTEGRDDDGDEAWNEDGPGGVNPNRNFPAGYRFFEPDAGAHPLSDVTARRLADFLIANPNVGAVFTLGAGDNLTEPPKAEDAGKKVPAGMQERDLPWVRELGVAWRAAMRMEKEIPGATAAGSFPDWVYLHRGRLALAARPWFPAAAIQFTREADAEKDKKATGTNAVPKAASDERKSAPDKRNEDERAFLKWVDRHAPGGFLDWKEIQHGDFPGRKVEVGGYLPWIRSHPPESLAGDVVARQVGFVVELARRLPRIGIRRTEVRPKGSGVFEIRVEVENTGWLPTVLAQGEITREVLPTRVTLGVDDPSIVSGTRIQRLGPIPGSGGMQEVRWVILASGRREAEVEVISALAGRVRTSVSLEEGRP